MNREILQNMLSRDYDILAAESGAKALAMLRESHSLVSAVLLDLKMPGMDGFEVLKAIRAEGLYQSIPVIVATSMSDVEAEEQAVSLGAYGFVTKPYRSVLIKRHLNNAITFRESASLQNRIRRDDLTKILNFRGFTEQAETLIKSKPLGYYMLSCFDVDSFKVINDQYGTDKGDLVLKHIAQVIDQCVTPLGGICCRSGADDFAALYPVSYLGSDELSRGFRWLTNPDCISRTVGVRIGRYLVDEGAVSVSTMYDRAMLAKESIRGRYDVHEATYDDAMRRQLLHEQRIVSEMGAALEDRQFEVWYQPQFNHASGAMIGAEALVRWRHPLRGLIAPGEFVPVFERNGFIYALDRYIWEQVCADLRRWIDLGRDPLPVSVNISREDISKADVAEVLTGLVQSYGLDISLLRLEITESAFAESSDLVVSVTKRLIDQGFTVEIDDFGSGYSSLNTLKDVPAQIIKLDMKFLETGNDSRRGGSIIESVVRMAKWLGMSVIAEGVETVAQADYLRSIGCYYMQGYLYARPMPRDQYEVFCAVAGKEEHMLALETVDNLDNNSFWDPESMDTLIFNSYVGGACIYEYHRGRIELLRATEKYAQVIGSAGMTVEDALRLDWAEHLDAESARRLIGDLEKSIATKSEVAGEYVFLDLPNCPHVTYLRSALRVIASAGERYLVYCTNENVTAQRQAERELREATEQIRALMNDTPGGFTRTLIRQDGTGLVVYANDVFLEMRGLDRDAVVGKPIDILIDNIHPDDIEGFLAERRHAIEADSLLNTKYRLRKMDGTYGWTQLFARYVKTENGDTIVNCYYADLTEMEKRKLTIRETMPLILSAIMESSENLDFAKDRDFKYICCSPAFVRFTRQKCEADVLGKSDYELWTKEEADHFRADDMRLFESGESLINFTEPIPSDDGVQHYSVTSKYILRDSSGEIVGLYGSGRDITDTRAALDRLQLVTDSIPGGIATYAVSPEGISISYFNDGFCAMLGYTREEYMELSAVSVNSRVLPEDRPALMAQVKRLYDTGEPIDCTYRNLRADGEGIITVNFRGVLVARQGDTAYVNAVLYDVTAQKEAEQNARETAEQLSVIMENIRGGISAVTLGEDGEISFAFANSRFYEILGFTKEQFEAEVGKVIELVFPEDIARIQAAMNRVIATGEPDSYEYRCVRRDGSIAYLRCHAACTSMSGVGDRVLLSVITDITEIVEAREKEASAQRSLLDNLPGGAGIYEFKDGQLSLTYQNKSYWELVGLQEEAYPDNAPISAVHPDDVPVIMNELRSALQQSRDIECDIRLRHLTEGYRPVHLAGRIVLREDGGFRIYATFTPTDSAGLTYQQTLPLLLSTIMEASNDFVFAKDRDLRYVCCSPAFLTLAGLSEGREVIGRTDFELFPSDMAERFRENDLELLETGKPMIDFDETIHFPDGSVHYCLASKHVLRDASGEAIGIYGMSRDITSQRDALEQLQLVSDNLPGGIATYSYRDGVANIEYCNEGFCRLFGGSREGLLQRGDIDPTDWVFAQDLPELREHIVTLARDETPFDAVFRVHVIGGYKWINEKAVFSQRRGDAVFFNVILLDVTERQLASEQLRISEEETALAVQHGGNIVCRYSIAERTLTLVSDSVEAHGIPKVLTDVPYEPVRQGFISPETADAYICFFEDILKGGRAGSVLFQQKYFGQWRWEEAQSSTVFADDGAPVKAIISMSDATDRIEKENIYKKWQQSLTDRAPGSYTLFTINISHRSDYDAREGLLLSFDFEHAGENSAEVARAYAEQCIYAEDRDKYVAFVNADTMLASYYRGHRSDSIEYRELTGDGGTRWLRLTVDLVEYPNSTDVEAYLMYEDIDSEKRTELETRELAETDPLTGVLNRAAFAARVDQRLRASPPDRRHALLMLDLDGFKQVNDVFGHGAGDQALIDIASGVSAVMRQGDLVARLGGDEFIVFLENIRDADAAVAKARQLRAIARRSFSMEVQLSVSIGIAMSPRDGTDFGVLYKKADSALYFVKGSGKDSQAVYRENMADEHLEPEPDAYEPGGMKLAEKKRRMLIVDDSRIDYAMLQNIFCDEFKIEKAKDGATALGRLRHYGSAISVVLLDLMMPGMDGFAVLEKMQESAELRSIPVIIVSGDESRDTCLRAIRKGATDFITKPVDTELLRIRVHSAVSKAENERLRAKNSLLEVMNEERVRYDSALESTGITFVEFDWRTGEFTYYPSISRYLLGSYDRRPFWQILLSDMVTDTRTVQLLQQLVHQVAEDKTRPLATVKVPLKTPGGELHRFRVTVRRLSGEFQSASKLIITLDDLDYEVRDER